MVEGFVNPVRTQSSSNPSVVEIGCIGLSQGLPVLRYNRLPFSGLGTFFYLHGGLNISINDNFLQLQRQRHLEHGDSNTPTM